MNPRPDFVENPACILVWIALLGIFSRAVQYKTLLFPGSLQNAPMKITPVTDLTGHDPLRRGMNIDGKQPMEK
jgi:hypothetical protein